MVKLTNFGSVICQMFGAHKCIWTGGRKQVPCSKYYHNAFMQV